MNIEPLTVAFTLCLGVVLVGGAVAGYIVVDRSFRKNIVDESNARDLLAEGNVSGWNAYRRLNPEWRPVFRNADFTGTVLPEVDLKNSDLTGALFNSANLDGADFSSAILTKADFSEASLRRAIFDGANLTDASFRRATMHEASLQNVEKSGADFEGTIGHAVQSSGAPAERATVDAEDMAALSPLAFEQFVADLLIRLGYRVDHSPSSQDSGVDMVATLQTPLGESRVVVQVKRLSDPTRAIGQEAVRALAGLRQIYPADSALLVTNGRFSRAATETAAAIEGVQLVDGTRLAELRRAVAG